MIGYLDSSVLLRVLLRQPGQLREFRKTSKWVTSSLTEVECLRTLDRQLVRGSLTPAEFSHCRGVAIQMLATFETVELGRTILNRAAQQMASPLGTLDALHLVTALCWKELMQVDLVLATHDEVLGLAARSFGLVVLGV